MGSILQVQSLSKTYQHGKVQDTILTNINFCLNEGDFVAIMGSSGSGKSTLLHLISGMDRPSSGEVYFYNTAIGNLSEQDMAKFRLEKIGFVFQKTALLNTICLFDNIVLPAYVLKKEKRRNINEKANQLMEKLGIKDKAPAAVDNLSGGELQRGCICRALINTPSVLFADEPTGALNSQASEQVMEAFKKINSDGTTILLVTHDPNVAARANRIVYLADGMIERELLLDCKMKQADRNKKILEWVN